MQNAYAHALVTECDDYWSGCYSNPILDSAVDCVIYDVEMGYKVYRHLFTFDGHESAFLLRLWPKNSLQEHISTYKMEVNGKVGPTIKSHTTNTSPKPRCSHYAWAPHIVFQY